MTRLACLALLLTACFNPLDNPDAKQLCKTHDSLASCTADDACQAATCAGCGSTTTFSGCYGRGETNPYGACPALGCATAAACSTYKDAASCTAAHCDAEMCPGCGGNFFNGCFDPGVPLHCEPVECPAICPQYDNDADCSANPSCYSLFKDGDTCDCSGVGCCMEFFQCATGPAQCGTGPSCDNPPLDLTCGNGYTTGVISGGGCVLGCIRDTLCTN